MLRMLVYALDGVCKQKQEKSTGINRGEGKSEEED